MSVIERLEALAEKATPLPWKVGDLLDPAVSAFSDGTQGIREDAEFTAAAVNALPDLLKLARAAKELLDDLKAEHDWDDGTPIESALEPLFREEASR